MFWCKQKNIAGGGVTVGGGGERGGWTEGCICMSCSPGLIDYSKPFPHSLFVQFILYFSRENDTSHEATSTPTHTHSWGFLPHPRVIHKHLLGELTLTYFWSQPRQRPGCELSGRL